MKGTNKIIHEWTCLKEVGSKYGEDSQLGFVFVIPTFFLELGQNTIKIRNKRSYFTECQFKEIPPQTFKTNVRRAYHWKQMNEGVLKNWIEENCRENSIEFIVDIIFHYWKKISRGLSKTNLLIVNEKPEPVCSDKIFLTSQT